MTCTVRYDGAIYSVVMDVCPGSEQGEVLSLVSTIFIEGIGIGFNQNSRMEDHRTPLQGVSKDYAKSMANNMV